MLLRLRRWEEARNTLHEALQAHPQSPRLLAQLNRWGFLQLREQQYFHARQAFEYALSTNPKSRSALAGCIASFRQAGRRQEARNAVEAALSSFPQDRRLLRELNRLGFDYLTDQQYTLALNAFERRLGLGERDQDALVGRAIAQWLLGRREDACRTVEAAFAHHPRERVIEKLNEAGDSLLGPDTARVYELVLSIAPRNETALLRRASFLRQDGKLEDARRLLEDALTVRPKGPRIVEELYELGLSHLELGQNAKALETFERVLALEPLHPGALAGRATALQVLGKASDARESVNAARADLPLGSLLEGFFAIGRISHTAPDTVLAACELALVADPMNAGAFNLRADVLFWSGNEEAHREAVREALLLLPGDAGLVSRLMGIAFRDYTRGYYDKALEAFERVLSLAPDDTLALRWRAASLRGLGSVAEAAVKIEDAAFKHPEDGGLLVELGLTYRHLRRFNDALAAFDRAMAVPPPPTAEAPLGKAACLRRLHRYDEALKVVDEALAQWGFPPDSYASLFYERALVCWDTRQFPLAEAALADATARSPFWLEAALTRTELLLRLGRGPEAQEFIDELESLNAGDLKAQASLGWLYLRRRALGKAREKFEALPQGELDWEMGLGCVCFYREEYSAADRHFVRARALSPWNPTAHVNLAWALVNQEEPSLRPQAEGLCREALVLDPENANALECLGVIAAREGRLRDAEDGFLASICVAPAHGAYANLGALYVQEGRYTEAREQLALAIEFEPANTAAWLELGNLHWQLGDKREALQALRRAVAIEPDSTEPYRALALALTQVGECIEAEKLLRSALRRVDKPRSWRLHLALAQVLRTTADRANDHELYEEAHREVQAALQLWEDDSLWFEFGYILAKLDDLEGALAAFSRCGEANIEAKRNAARLRATLSARKLQTRGGRFGSWVLGVATLVQLVLVWGMVLFGSPEEKSKLLAFVPVLLALFAVAALLPWLTRLKLPGIEAELAQPKQLLTPGPTGGIALSISTPSITRGPPASLETSHPWGQAEVPPQMWRM